MAASEDHGLLGTDPSTIIVFGERTLAGLTQLLLWDEEGEKIQWVWEHDLLGDTTLAHKVAAWRALSPAAKKATALEHTDKTEQDDDYPVFHNEEIDSRAIQTSVRSCITGDQLPKHSVSEGCKAVAKMASSDPGCTLSSAAGLQIPVELVGSISSLLAGCPISKGAACYLGAVLEYLCAEILELSGNAARDMSFGQRRDNQVEAISPRHIYLGIWADEELERMFEHISILGGGVMPNIHSALLSVPEITEDTAAANYMANLVGAPDSEPATDDHEHPFYKEWGNANRGLGGLANPAEFCPRAVGEEEAVAAAQAGLEAASDEVARLHEPGQPAALAAAAHFTAIAAGEGGGAPLAVDPEVAAAQALEAKCQNVLEVLLEHQANPPPRAAPPDRSKAVILDAIPDSMLRALAARAGVVAMSEPCLEELRGKQHLHALTPPLPLPSPRPHRHPHGHHHPRPRPLRSCEVPDRRYFKGYFHLHGASSSKVRAAGGRRRGSEQARWHRRRHWADRHRPQAIDPRTAARRLGPVAGPAFTRGGERRIHAGRERKRKWERKRWRWRRRRWWSRRRRGERQRCWNVGGRATQATPAGGSCRPAKSRSRRGGGARWRWPHQFCGGAV